MIALLALVLAARDEVSDQIARLRAAVDASARYQAGHAVERAAKPAHVPLLLKEIEAGPLHVRKHLIPAVARIGTKDAVAGLRALCAKHELLSRLEAAEQLRWMDDELGMKTLVALLPRAETDEEKREALHAMHGGFSEGGEAVPALAKFLEKEKNADLRRIAVDALGSHKDPAVLPALRRLAADAKDPNRLDALAELVQKGDDPALEEALRALEAGGTETLATYRLVNAIEMSGKRSVLPRLRALLETSTDRTVRTSLIRALATLKDDKAIPLLSKLADGDDSAVTREALEAVIRLAGRSQLDLLRKVSQDGDSLRRLEAAEALLQLDLKEGLEAVKAELQSSTTSYRHQAVNILSRVRSKESIELLLPLLDDKTEYVRSSAKSAVVASLGTLFPYLRFDPDASPEKLRAWWEKHRPK